MFVCFVSEWQAGAGSGGSAAEPEAAGLSQQGGAAPAPEIHGCRSQIPGGQTAQRGERLCASRMSQNMRMFELC